MSDNYRALPKGTKLFEYIIEGVLGQGSFGITYLATEIKNNVQVAIKEYYPREFAVRDTTLTVKASGSKDDRDNFKWGLDRFRAESRVIALFQHPNIVGVKRFFNANGTAYLVMEYCNGIPLDEQLKQIGALSQNELIKLINPILDALELIHNSKYLHRDVKPGNIYIRNDGTPILLDFGAARQDLVSHSRSITSLATPGYAPYEQYSTNSHQGPSTDIYGFAATLYRVVTGKRPVDSPSRFMDDTLEKAQDIAAGKYDKDILRAIDAGLALKPTERPESIHEWRKMFGPMFSKNNYANEKEQSPHSEYIRVEFDNPKSINPEPTKIQLMEGKGTKSKILTLIGLGIFLIFIGFGYTNYLETNKPHTTPKPVPIPLASNNVIGESDSAAPSPPPNKSEPLPSSNGLPACPVNLPISSWNNCFGTYKFPPGGKRAGDSYKGAFMDGKREGYGIYTNAQGVVEYKGMWKNNEPINEMIVTPDSGRQSDLTLAQCNETADYLKKDLPKKVDSITNWTRTTCSMGANRPVFTYWYEVDTDDDFTQSTVNYLREDARRIVCGKSFTKIIPSLDIKYNYTYGAKKNFKYVGSLYFSLADCRK